MSNYEFDIETRSENKVSGHVRKTSDKIVSPTDIAAWSAIFISVVSLIFTIQQGFQTREHNIKSVTPYLKLSRFGITKGKIGVQLENNGVGPAVIENVSIYYKNSAVSSFYKLREAVNSEIKGLSGRLIYTEMNKGYYYAPDATVNLLEADESIPEDDRIKFAELMRNHTEVKIKYCSVYEKCSFVCLIAEKARCQ